MVTKQFVNMAKLIAITGMLSMGLAACEGDDDVAPVKQTFNLTASANAAQEVPTNSSTGTGTLTGTYDSVSNALTFQVSWTGLTGNVTNMHFHGPALPGVSAGVALAMPGWPATPAGTHSGTLTLSQTQEADLMAGKWYWNIHTAANGGGEIRGQVAVQ